MTAILNTSGTAVVQYSYDAWGNLLTTTGTHALANLNPLRYRGYVYDNETELYYLQSRYYNPETGRFLNSDVYACTGQGLLGNNTFAYCNNNPVVWQDSSGRALETIWDILSFAASVGDVLLNPLDPWAWVGLFADALDVAIPCVGGLGEAVDAIRVAIHTAETAHGVSCLSQIFEGGMNAIGETATSGSSYDKGSYGEMLAGIDQNAKISFEIDGRTRIPDAMTSTTLTEVKNVARISNTLQLQDYARYAQDTGRTLELYVRRGTHVAQTVLDAGWKILYLW